MLGKGWKKFKEFLHEESIELNSVIRSILYMICSTVCIYQVVMSCIDYYEYKTAVQIKIGNPETVTYPAITVCRQMTALEFVDMAAEKDHEFNKTKSKKKFNTSNGASAEEAYAADLDAIQDIAHYLRMPNRNSKMFFSMIAPSLLVNCTLVGSNISVPCEDKTNPIASFTHKRICYTYFSQLFSNIIYSENNLNNSDNTTEKEENTESVFAWLSIDSGNNDTFIYIHTSKSMPDINLYDIEMTRSRLVANGTYGLLYSKETVTRLEKPYITDCHNYRAMRKGPDDPLSEFGCINKCKKSFWKNNKDIRFRCLPIDMIYIMDSDDSKDKICNCTTKCDKRLSNCDQFLCPPVKSEVYKSWTTNCENKCHQDCYEEYYTKELFELKDDFQSTIYQKFDIIAKEVPINYSIIFLTSKSHEEKSYTHFCKMNSMDFFASMGGLFSLWIGASVMTIYDATVWAIKVGSDVKKKFVKKKTLFDKPNKFKSSAMKVSAIEKNMRESMERPEWYGDPTQRIRPRVPQYHRYINNQMIY